MIRFGPQTKYLDLDPSYISQDNSNVNIANSIISARFYHPFSASEGGWSYGFTFRDDQKGWCELRIGRDRRFWILYFNKNLDGTVDEPLKLSDGIIQNLRTDKDDYNDISLYIKDQIGHLYANDQLISIFDMPQPQKTGTVKIMGGIFLGDKKAGQRIYYENFLVRTIP